MQYRRGKLAFVDTVKYDFHQDSSWEKHTIKWYYLSSKPVKDYLSIELYNEDGFLKQTQEHNFYSGSKKYVGITYDSLKNKIESFIIKIDDQGRKDSIIENIDYDKQKQVQYFRFYSSEDTFLIKERYFDMADNIILKREIRIPNDTNTLRYKYNRFGFVIWEHWRSNNELREKSAHTFKYKLDSYNNWTEKNVLYNGRETNHYIRNIYYWE